MTNMVIWVWLLILSVLTGWSYWFAPDTVATDWWQGLMYVLAPITAVVVGIGAVRQFGIRAAQGKALFAIVLGISGLCMGDILWTYYDLITHTDPYPSLADAFYLLAYIPLAVGLILEIRFLHSQVRGINVGMQKFLFLIIALLLMGVAGYFGVYQSYKPDAGFLENGLVISYGLVDVVLVVFGLIIAVVASELRGGKMAQSWWWLLLGFLGIFIADIAFAMFTKQYEERSGYYKPVLDSIWIFAYLAMACGLHHFTWLIHSVQQYLQTAAKRNPLEVVKPAQRKRNRHKRK